MLIIAQDPGKKTGVKTYDTESGELWGDELDVREYFTWLHNLVYAAQAGGKEVRFVSESFVITVQTAKNSAANWSLELIGVMKFLAWQYFRAEVTMQTSGVGKTFGTDAKLKVVGWYVKGHGHENDAARHLMTYAATRRLIFDTETLKELAVL
jgi:hypothetical protein